MRRRAWQQRSVVEWGVRLGLAFLALWAGFAAVKSTLAYSLRERDPARAFALAPGDGRIAGLYAASRSGPEATAVDRRQADRLAARALAQDPTAIAAVSTLGINAQVRGDTPGARRFFAYAALLTRRDLQTQLWAIEDAVGSGDVPGALRHYDIALRTSRHASDLLFPVLASATADPNIRAALIGTLKGMPAWGNALIDYVAGNGPDPQSIADLFIGLARAGVSVSDNARRATVDGLIESGRLDQAWAYYAQLRPGASRTQSRDPHFLADLASPSLFDWRTLDDVGITTSVQRNGKAGVFDFSVAASVGGPLLEQLQALPPGRYRLSGRSNGIAAAEEMRPYWSLVCHGSNVELGRLPLPVSENASVPFTGYFDVPPGCGTQTLRLTAQPSDAMAGVSGTIEEAVLQPTFPGGERRP